MLAAPCQFAALGTLARRVSLGVRARLVPRGAAAGEGAENEREAAD